MSEPSTPPPRVLDAGLAVFARYGYRRASMADIAMEAGISRPALYQWFAGKAALLEAVAHRLTDQALAAAAQAWPPGEPLRPGLEAAILARDLPLLRLFAATPHGIELLSAAPTITEAARARLEDGFATLLADRAAALAAAGAIDLAAFGGPAGFGATFSRLAAASKQEADEPEFRRRIATLCSVAAAASRPAC